jgi:hypothetical protein
VLLCCAKMPSGTLRILLEVVVRQLSCVGLELCAENGAKQAYLGSC